MQSGPCIAESEGWGPGSAAAGYAPSASLAASLNATSLAALRRLRLNLCSGIQPRSPGRLFRLLSRRQRVRPRGHPGGATGGREGQPKRRHAAAAAPRGRKRSHARGGSHCRPHELRWHRSLRTRPRPSPMPQYRNGTIGCAPAFAPSQPPCSGSIRCSDTAKRTLQPASFIAADSDERVACPSRELAQLASRHMPGRVFTYVFEHMSTACDASFPLRVPSWWKPRSISRVADGPRTALR